MACRIVERLKESGVVMATIQYENGQGFSLGQQVGEGDRRHLLNGWCLIMEGSLEQSEVRRRGTQCTDQIRR